MNKLTLSLITIAMAACSASAAVPASVKWHSSDSLPLLGKCVDDASTSERFQRLPDSLQHKVKRPPLYSLGLHSTGMAIRFASDAPDIYVKWKSRFKGDMNIMTPTAVRGLDLYMMMPDSTWTFAQSCRPDLSSDRTEVLALGNMDVKPREYMLYLSLYDGVQELSIGADSLYSVTRPHIALPEVEHPVVYYGTSLVHGGCVNRAGMSHTNQLRRRLNRDVVNLGFGGNGQLDLEIADVIAAVPSPSLIVLDFVANCSTEQIDTLMIPFTDIVRAAHPNVPILYIECRDHPRDQFDLVSRAIDNEHNVMMRRRYEDIARKYANVHYLAAKEFRSKDFEGTVDGLHLTDYGSIQFADSLEPVFRALMGE